MCFCISYFCDEISCQKNGETQIYEKIEFCGFLGYTIITTFLNWLLLLYLRQQIK